MLGSAGRGVRRGSIEVRLSAVKLFSKNSNLYDHDTLASQTDRQTDGQLAMAKYRALRSIALSRNTTPCTFYRPNRQARLVHKAIRACTSVSVAVGLLSVNAVMEIKIENKKAVLSQR